MDESGYQVNAVDVVLEDGPWRVFAHEVESSRVPTATDGCTCLDILKAKVTTCISAPHANNKAACGPNIYTLEARGHQGSAWTEQMHTGSKGPPRQRMDTKVSTLEARGHQGSAWIQHMCTGGRTQHMHTRGWGVHARPLQ
eukprot:717583-Pelagomonas_calceolata.AAC.5